jgi:hypothetical protein
MDARTRLTPADDVLERDLRALLEVEAPPWLESAVRARVDEAGSHVDVNRGHDWRRVQRYLLVAAVLIVAAAACAVVVDRLAPFGRTGSVEVGRGTPLDLTAEASGWRLTLVNAYADANQLELFLFADALDSEPETTTVMARDITVTDDAGRTFPIGGSGHSSLHDGRSTQDISFGPPDATLAEGEHRLTARVDSLEVGREVGAGEREYERVAGPWTFEFDVASQGGTLVEPGTTDVRDGVAITLDRLSVSPSMIRAWLTIEGAPDGVDWMPTLLVEKGPKAWEAHGRDSDWADGRMSVTADAHGGGLDDVPGAWSVEVYSLAEYDPVDDRNVQELPGPWDLSFEASR